MKPSHSLSVITGLFIPILLWSLFTPWSAWLDLKITRAFYVEGSFSSEPFWSWLYVYGLWPAWIMIGLALVGVALSFYQSYHSWRKPCLFLILTFAVGAGLIIHAGLKDYWGRPRPKQVTEFGGEHSFRPYYSPHFKPQLPSKSFASGHASSGFYFFALTILGSVYQSRRLYWLGWGLGLGLGGLLSIARIAQGGHFLSDTLASALIMWITAWGLAYVMLRNSPKRLSSI